MEESLLAKQREEGISGGLLGLRWDVFISEAGRLGYIAGPMVAVFLSGYLFQVVVMMMVGHVSELALSSSAVAISLSAVTGFSLIIGMSSALETLCGQAYGAKQYQKLGHQTYTAIFSLTLVALSISLLWANVEKLLLLTGQDPLIAHEAGRFIKWLIPALLALAFFQPLVRFYQSQSLIIPMLASTCLTLSLHVPLCWVLVFKSGLGSIGGALAISVSNWLNVVFLGVHMRYSSACEATRAPVSMELFRGIGKFFRLAVPSAVMVCLQWWSYEFVVLLSGLLPNPQLETSVLSICLTTIATLYSIPNGLGAAVSTRVSNELGAGNPGAARTSVSAVMVVGAAELVVVSGTLFATRHVFGYSFSSEVRVVEYVSDIAPLVCVSVVIDGLQGILSGVARGCGWQHVGANVNLGTLYLCGVPAAAMLGFRFQLRGKGLWIGIQVGALLQTVVLFVVASRTNWEKQAIEAKDRIFGGKSPNVLNDVA